MSSKENNPGNFANRPKEEVREAARKGGEASHAGGFASMDAEKQVFYIFHLESYSHLGVMISHECDRITVIPSNLPTKNHLRDIVFISQKNTLRVKVCACVCERERKRACKNTYVPHTPSRLFEVNRRCRHPM
jgi:hypothetical protein